MVAINVSRVCADAVKREKLTSGMQGTEVSFFFSADWDGLVKTAVFEGSGQSVDVLLTGASCEIPPAALKKYGGMLRVGVYGVSADGTTIIPTVYADLGIIRRGADPQKDPTTNSSLPVWAQLQAQIGDLSNLTTEDKTNLVAAINEAAKSGGGGGGGKDGTGIESITYKGEDESGGNMYTVLLTDGTSYDITAPKGAAGADGTPGIVISSEEPTDPNHPVWIDPEGDETPDNPLDITGATVGQIAKIAAVDASGIPTAWSPVDMPSGGGGETWELIAEIDFNVDAANDVSVWEYKNLPSYKELAYKKVSLVGSTEQQSGLSVAINGSPSQPTAIGYAKNGGQSNGWGKIFLLPFGWMHVNSGDSNSPTNHSTGGLVTMYNAIQFSGDSITSVRLSSHLTYKIAGGKLSLYGRR